VKWKLKVNMAIDVWGMEASIGFLNVSEQWKTVKVYQNFLDI
jgi:hypothetical protein